MTQPRAAAQRTGVLMAEVVALALILVLAAYFRFTDLMTNPGWYSDEGTVADIARHMAEGRTQYLALSKSTLLVARFPVVPFLVSRLMAFGGSSLETLRATTASLGVLSTLAVYWLVRLSGGYRTGALALLSALLYAIYPPAVFYSRIGFSYSLITPLVVIVAGATWWYLERGRRAGLIIASLAIGLGTVTDLIMVSIAAPVAIAVIVSRPRELAWWIPLTLTPLALYSLAHILSDAQVFAFDLGFILELMSAVPWWAQLPLIAVNLGTLALDDPWWIPGLLGLLLLQGDRWKRLLLLSFLLPLVLLARTAGVAGVRLYSISPLFPFIAIGMGNLLWIGVPWLLALARDAIRDQLNRLAWFDNRQWLQTRILVLGSAGVVFLIVLAPFLVSAFQLATEVRDGFRILERWAYLPASAASSAVDYVNRRAAASDLVLASPAIAWALHSEVADFQQKIAFDGAVSVDYPGNVPRDRFAFDISLERVRYAIIDPIWREWGAAHIAEVARLLEQIEGWPVVFEAAGIEVRANEN